MHNDSAVTLPVAFFWIIKQSSLAVTTTNHNLVQFRMPYTSHHTLSRETIQKLDMCTTLVILSAFYFQ